MKRIIKISILSLALLVSPVFANNLFNVSIGKTQFQVKEAGVLVNGKLLNTEFSPYIKQGRTFVPIREITENLGADVKWNNKDKSIKISLNGDVINMKINSPNVSVNGKKVSLDNAQAPQLALYSSPRKETKTMVPLRFISETFGYDVDWNNDEVRAEISTDKSKSNVDGDDKENSKDTKKNKNSKSNKKTKSKNKSIDSKSIFDSDYFQSNQEKRETNKIKKEINDGNKDKVFDQADLEKSDEKAKRVIKNRIEVNGKLKIVIDPGHGGKDSGAIALDGETYEKTVNLLVAERLMDKLNANSEISPTITRTRDEYIQLLDRAGVSNNGDAHLFLSIHFNSADNSSAKGIEVLYASEKNVRIKDTVQKNFANCLQKALIKETGAVNRGIINRPAIIVLNKTKNVAALAELGFLSNPDELEKIKDPDYIDKLAQGLYNGIVDYMNTYVDK